MRVVPVIAVLLAAPALAGCLAQPIAPQSLAPPLEVGAVEVPEGATLEQIPGGAVLRWADVALSPFRSNVTIPRGATLVRITATVADNVPVSVGMSHAETGRRRCNGPFVTAWDVSYVGSVSCAGLTAMDQLPAVWVVSALAAATPGATPLDPATPAIGSVQVELLSGPLDGIAAQLDLRQLSMLTYDLLPTSFVDIPAHDGALLHLEVTRPDTSEKVPVILASSPYNHAERAAGRIAQWTYFVQDWAKRGYGVVMADVRGFGESGGCVEVWGPNEQRDQATLVDWAASQEWSDGNVGFYGQSYVGTTPVEAAVQAPDALKAIVAIAPVINAYDDWHFGGVPNGEAAGSTQGYQRLGTEAMMPPDQDPIRAADNTANGLCDPTLAARANDPRALYDQFYEERNFSARASEVKAAVLYTQGFEDSNVKSAMITHWFNALPSKKLGLFGHWIHQHPTRADQEVLFLAWMDQYVKGKPMGFERLPGADVVANDGTHRTADAWPPAAPAWQALYPDFASLTLNAEPSEGAGAFLVTPEGPPLQLGLPATAVPYQLSAEGPAPAGLRFAGDARVHLKATLQGIDNAHVAAFLYDVGPESAAQVTWGMANLAHRNGHDRYDPIGPGEVVSMDLPLLPTEWVVAEGHTLRLVVRAAHVTDWFAVDPGRPGIVTLQGGADGTALLLPLAPAEGVAPLPASASL
ncbi:MAG TPA: CocE/NonD family hydrolase [Candidatus Thermoplasmatota archaeon]|jgi:hypothetical protein|nr:CocE/NonD family hydrolase [Candidatus Thermoplasmatota archaeon]